MKRLMTRALALTLALVACLSLTVPAGAATIIIGDGTVTVEAEDSTDETTTKRTDFPDVPRDHWARDHIDYTAYLGVVSGYDDGTFRPDNSVTGAHFVVMMTRAFFPDMIDTPSQTDGQWWEPFAVAAADTILAGTPMADTYKATGAFDAAEMDAPLNRYNMAQMMYNTLLALDTTLPDKTALAATQAEIADFAAVPERYADAVTMMYHVECLTGTDSAGTFNGQNNMNRAQACVVISRLSEVVPIILTPENQEDVIFPYVGQELRIQLPENAPNGKLYVSNPFRAELNRKDNTVLVTAPHELTITYMSGTRVIYDWFFICPSRTTGDWAYWPEQEEGTLTNGQAITEKNVQALLYSFKDEFPQGTPFEDYNYHHSEVFGMSKACGAFASICSDEIFGNLPISAKHENFDAIRVGDYIVFDSGVDEEGVDQTHAVLVLEKSGNSVVVAEGNYNDIVNWGRRISRSELERAYFQVITRYPAEQAG